MFSFVFVLTQALYRERMGGYPCVANKTRQIIQDGAENADEAQKVALAYHRNPMLICSTHLNTIVISVIVKI